MTYEPEHADEAQLQALFNQLVGQLSNQKYPCDWWQRRRDAIEYLHERSPRLFAELVQRYRARDRQPWTEDDA
jgi:hypothetical protein